MLDFYQAQDQTGAESPPQLPASKASPPTTTKRIPSSPMNKKSPNIAASVTPKATPVVAAKPAAPVPPVQTTDNSLDNQPIPKLITTNESVHYSYASAYGAIYQQHYHGVSTTQIPGGAMHPPVVPNSMYAAAAAVNQYAQPTMAPTLQAAPMQQFPQTNPAANPYYQPPPPPAGSRNNYYN